MFPGELRAFHVVAQTGSIRKASEALDVAPSSVSRKIALLEHQIGTTLLERTAAGVVLTHAGRMVAEYARTVVLDYESLRADLNDRRGTRRRLVGLATVESAVSGGLVDAIAGFRSRFASVSFRVNTMSASEVVENVKRGESEVGLTFCCPAQAEVDIVTSIVEPIVLAVPLDHPLARVSSVRLGELKDMVLALPDVSFGVRRILDRASHEIGLGVALNPAFTSNSFEALRNFVHRGGGIAVLPQRAVLRDSQLGHLRMVSIDHAAFRETSIDVITLKKRRIPRVVQEFIQDLGHAFNAIATPPR
ncbi:MAG: LysR family transcriptional regulator [Gammaproteobacteria bacterium]